MSTPILPSAMPTSPRAFGAADGQVILHAGRYARECVLLAFEMMGGVERLAHWATENPTEFYTRLYARTITKEVEVSAGGGIEELLSTLDGQRALPQPIHGAEEIQDAEIIDEHGEAD